MVNKNSPQNSILTLTTKRAERKKITIDDTAYEVVGMEELSLAEQHLLARMAHKIKTIYEFSGPDKPEGWYEEEYKKTVHLMSSNLETILKAPSEVLAKLKDFHVVQIFSTVFQSGEVAGEQPPQKKKESLKTRVTPT